MMRQVHTNEVDSSLHGPRLGRIKERNIFRHFIRKDHMQEGEDNMNFVDNSLVFSGKRGMAL